MKQLQTKTYPYKEVMPSLIRECGSMEWAWLLSLESLRNAPMISYHTLKSHNFQKAQSHTLFCSFVLFCFVVFFVFFFFLFFCFVLFCFVLF